MDNYLYKHCRMQLTLFLSRNTEASGDPQADTRSGGWRFVEESIVSTQDWG
jgi:hypothetical protein